MKMIVMAGLVFATPAMAADVTLKAEADAPIGSAFTYGDFSAPEETDRYRVFLRQGKDYAFAVEPLNRGAIRGRVLGPLGAVLCDLVTGDNFDDGCGIRAGRDGYFVLELTKIDYDEDAYPSRYRTRVVSDCSDRTNTHCRIVPGQTKQPLFAFGTDRDLLRLRDLTGGRTYTAAIEDGLLGAAVEIIDSAGQTVAGPGTTVSFKAGGPLWLRAAVTDDLGLRAYRLSLR